MYFPHAEFLYKINIEMFNLAKGILQRQSDSGAAFPSKDDDDIISSFLLPLRPLRIQKELHGKQ